VPNKFAFDPFISTQNDIIEQISDCCLTQNEQFFQLFHGKNRLHSDEMMMMSILYTTNTLSWIFIVLARLNNSQWVDLSLHTAYYSDSEPTSFSSHSLILTNAHLWLELTRTLTYNLPHYRPAR
jgi:hypothetical protein